MKQVPILLACLAGTVVFTVLACGPAAAPGSSADSGGPPRTQAERERALAAHREYFEKVLFESGHDSETRVGEDLTVLSLDWQQLQMMPVDQAYALTHGAVMRFPDPSVRRQMLLSLFNETDDR